MTRKLVVIALLTVLVASMFIGLSSAYLGGCVMSLPFNEGAGSVTYDETGNGNNGAIIANWTTGQFGSALRCNGTTDYVEVPDSDSISITGDITIIAWIKPADFSGYMGIVSKTDADLPAPWDFYLTATSGVPCFLRGNGDTFESVSGDSAPIPNQWTQIAVTMEGTTVTHYLNGEPNGEGTLSTTIIDANTPLRVGNRNSDDTPFKGGIDEVQLYNRALSVTEISNMYSTQQQVVVVGEEVSTLYMRSDLYTVSNQSGYGLDSTNTATTATLSQSGVDDTIYWGFRVYLLNQAGQTRELTAGTPVAQVSRSGNGAGAQSNTYSMGSKQLVAGAEALMVKVYSKVGAGGTWAVKATFLSNTLLATTIEASTWTFTLYTNLTDTDASFSFGASTTESKISGLSFTEPDLWGMAMYYFRTNNYVMFFLYPYVRLIGMSPFVSLIMFGIGLTVYIRFRNFYFLLLVLVMLSIGGVLQFIMGDALMGFVALLCTFALGALYWKVFR